MGAPKATEIPAAAAADKTSRFRAIPYGKDIAIQWAHLEHVPSLWFRLPKGFNIKLAQQHATCTSGPSLPNHNPDATERHFQM